MKKQLFIYLFISLVGGNLCIAANKKLTASPESVISAYIDAFKNSDADILKEIMHDEAYISMPRQGQVIRHNKKQLVQFYKKENKNTLNCGTSQELVSYCESMVVATVDFKFENFIQRNFITIEKNQDNEWKVMNISKFFI